MASRLRRALLAAYILGCAMPLAIPLVQGGRAVVVAIFIGALFLEAIGLAVTQVHVSSLRQCIAPREQFGRMNATYRFFVSGMTPLGALCGGFCGAALGLRPTLLLCGLGMIGALGWIIFSPLPQLRALPEPMEEVEMVASAPAASTPVVA